MKQADDFTCDQCHIEVNALFVIDGQEHLGEFCRPCGEAAREGLLAVAAAKREAQRRERVSNDRSGDIRFASLEACAWSS